MKIKAHKTRQVLYVLARFEEFKMCEFTGGAQFAVTRLSKADERKACFYLLIKPSTIGELYRQGEFIGHVFPAGDDGWQSKKFGFKLLEKLHPLPVNQD